MQQAEFDKFAEAYRDLHAASIRASGETPDFFAEYKVRDLAGIVRDRRIDARRVLDFGAGIGGSVPHFRAHLPGTAITCIDVSERSLDIGRSRFAGQAEFMCFDGSRLPFDPGAFDAVFCACVFHHIDTDEHVALMRELHRVLRPGGILAVFEHNPLNPLTVRAVEACRYDENAVLVSAPDMVRRIRSAGFSAVERRFRIFFPRALRGLRPLERWMRWCPLGAQYLVSACK